MSQYKPYPAYKDSGVEWLGHVPEHWAVVRLRHVIDGSLTYGANEAAESDEPNDPRFIRITDLNDDGTLREDIFKSLPIDIARPYLLEDGDVLLARSGATVGKSFIYRREMGRSCYAGYLIRARLFKEKMLPRVLWYCTQSGCYWDFIASSSIQATIQNVSAERYSNFWLAAPSIAEQHRIVSSLDCEVNRIDSLVEKKTSFIDLLREKRRALTIHAITKGLNPAVQMKDSGFEWLGLVPGHWDITPLKYVVRSMGQGWSPECEARSPEYGEWGVLKVGCVNGGVFRPEESKALPSEMQPRPELGLKAGDVLISRANTRDLVGSCAVVPRDYPYLLLCDKLYRVGCNARITPEFFAALVSVYGRRIVEIEATGASSSMVNIAQSVILNLLVAVPDTNEQIEIINRITAETARIDQLRDVTERSIALLKERRTALITAAVTGQIDLREAV